MLSIMQGANLLACYVITPCRPKGSDKPLAPSFGRLQTGSHTEPPQFRSGFDTSGVRKWTIFFYSLYSFLINLFRFWPPLSIWCIFRHSFHVSTCMRIFYNQQKCFYPLGKLLSSVFALFINSSHCSMFCIEHSKQGKQTFSQGEFSTTMLLCWTLPNSHTHTHMHIDTREGEAISEPLSWL